MNDLTLPQAGLIRQAARACARCPSLARRNLLGLCYECYSLFTRHNRRSTGKLTIPDFLNQFPWTEEVPVLNVQVKPVDFVQEPDPIPSRGEALPGMIYQDTSMERLADLVRKVARTTMSVLIMGETGTGKELVARAIHALSPRSTKPYRVVDCTTLTPDIAPSELFGHIAGAFTSATRNQKGLLAEADSGTVFLDELSALSLTIQAQFLRVLESSEFRQVGSGHYTPLDIRVVAASNEPLKELVKSGHFRSDLYHRINVFPIVLPPLRKRGNDIDLLTRHFLQSATANSKPSDITPDAMARLRSYPWPGNVRELHHVLARALILRKNEHAPITRNELPTEIFDGDQVE